MFFNKNINDCKLLVFDLDGTILGKKSNISNKMIELCSILKKQDILFTIATGRSSKPALNYANILGIEIPIICLGGSLIINPINNKIIRETKIDKKISQRFLKTLDQEKYEPALYFGSNLYIKQISKWSKGYIERQKIPYFIDKNFSIISKNNPTMILIVGNPDDIDSLEKKLPKLIKNSLYVVRSMPHFCELSNLKGNKFFALKFLLETLNLNFSNVITFGNGEADIEIIKSSQIGISINNSSKKLLKDSDFSIAPPEEQGVENFIEKYILK